MKPKVLALIPARGGSKGIPHKNLVPFADKPLIAHSVIAGLAAEAITDVVVSTDDEAIARVASELGARTPFLRPRELAEDATPTAPVLDHALRWLEANEGCTYDWVALLQPTSPLRTARDIDEAMELVSASPKWRSLVSLTRVEEPHPQKMKVIVDGEVRPLLNPSGPNVAIRRQDCPPVFALNGALYVFRPRDLFETGEILRSPVLPYVMPPERSVNIDSPLDLAFAEALLRRATSG